MDVKGANNRSEQLLDRLNAGRLIHVVAATVQSTFFIRFAICSTQTNADDIRYAWSVIEQIVNDGIE
jgi:hypothetical protein